MKYKGHEIYVSETRTIRAIYKVDEQGEAAAHFNTEVVEEIAVEYLSSDGTLYPTINALKKAIDKAEELDDDGLEYVYRTNWEGE